MLFYRMRYEFCAAVMALVCLAAGCISFSRQDRKLIRQCDGQIMRVLKVTSSQDSIALRRVSEPLSARDVQSEDFSRLAASLLRTVTDPRDPGVGIAAPQVGVARRMILVQRFDTEGMPFELMVNPELKPLGDSLVTSVEGCLSVPSGKDSLLRYHSVVLTYRDSLFNLRRDTLSGFTSIIVQHECDHLEGILFTDRVRHDNERITSKFP